MYEPRTPSVSYGPFERWGINAIRSLPRKRSGKEYIIVAVDYMNRWVEAASMQTTTKQDIGKLIYDFICCRFGIPLDLVFHHDPGSRSDALNDLLSIIRIHPFHLVYRQETLLPIEVGIQSFRVLLKESGQIEQEVIQKRLTDLQELNMNRELEVEHHMNQVEKRRQEFNKQLKDKRHDTKFQPRWEGPFFIKTKFKNGSYQLIVGVDQSPIEDLKDKEWR
ncbi:hypothetical protein KP509_38G014500 [Ceratopteris richardii]|uniref:Integrase catalytic domain-containing protein n=1 Tax=Ceratopteris richardii TaxID=49495 RepID=A0A8T2Q397_CERRI|nr:hypothetical protein KP509_38G014500 [Ceratopteris richardii]